MPDIEAFGRLIGSKNDHETKTVEAFGRLIGSKNDHETKAWLFRGFADDVWEPLSLAAEPHVCVQLQQLHDHVPLEARERLKTASVLVLREWRRAAHKYPVLGKASVLAMLLKATPAIRVLSDILKRLMPHSGETQAFRALEDAVYALTGFSPGEDVHAELVSLFYLDGLDPRFAGQLFNGLCSCKPDLFWEHVPRLRVLLEANPDYVDPLWLGAQLLDEVGPHRFVAGLGRLPMPERASLVTMVHLVPDTGLEFDIGGAAVRLQQGGRQQRQVAISTPGAGRRLATLERFTAPFRSPEINEVLLRAMPQIGIQRRGTTRPRR